MDFTYSKKVSDLIEQLTNFMDKHIYPNDQAYRDHFKTTDNIWQQPPLMSDLKKKKSILVPDFNNKPNLKLP